MSGENRLTAEQLSALIPGDVVTLESGNEFGGRRHTTGTVARITARHVVVRCGAYIECYGLRDGLRMVAPDEPSSSTSAHVRTAQLRAVHAGSTSSTASGPATAPTWTGCRSCGTRSVSC